jgi:hypothetical protein
MHLATAGRTRSPLSVIGRGGLIAALVVLLGTPVLAQGYPPSSETLSVSTSVAVPGEPITVSGSGYAPGTTVTITFESTPRVIGVLQADASGRFTAQVVVPADATPGMHTIRATGLGDDGSTRVVSAAIMVMAPAAAAAPGRDVGGPRPGDPGSAAVAQSPPVRGGATGGSSPRADAPGAWHRPAAASAEDGRRSSRLSLTGPVAIPLLLAAAVGSAALGTVLSRARRRRPLR